ncbi:MAG: ATP-binding cassette subfamily B protein, partial [Limisphaerales bacterium]
MSNQNSNVFQEKEFRQKGALVPFLKRILKVSLKHKKDMYQFLFWIVIVAIADAIFPIVVMNLIDKELGPRLAENIGAGIQGQTDSNAPEGFRSAIKYVLIFFAIGMAQVTGVFFFVRHAGRVQEFVLFDLRKQLFDKLQELQASFYDKNAIGWLLTRLTSDTDRVTELISWGLVDLIWGLVMINVCIMVLFVYSWKIALMVLLSLPLLLIASVRIRMLVLKWSRVSRKINSEITASFNEHIGGVQLIKATVQERATGQEFSKLSGAMRRASFRASGYTAIYGPLVIFIGSIVAAGVILLGGQLAIAVPAGITVGVLAASFEYATRIFLPVLDISRFYALAQGSLSAGERIFSLLDEPVLIQDPENGASFDKIEGVIEFDQVSFSYVEDKPVLSNMSFYIPSGQSVALVGPTGEGKSTIAKLVGRYYDINEGAIKVDGVDIRDRKMESLRIQMGVVLQHPHLFSGSIRSNIKYGKPDATEEELIDAIRILGAEEFISRLDEEVGEAGVSLSEGERQIISFIRAVLANPAILVMDEATSSVDTVMEQKIQRGVKKIIKNRTSIIIAHRLSTIKSCDRIIV